MEEQRLYTAEEVAEMLRVKPLTIYHMVKDGRLQGHKIGRHLRFTRENINEWLAQSRTSPSTSPSASPSQEPEPEE